MGANSTQAAGTLVFLGAFVFLAGALAMGGSLIFGLAGLCGLGAAVAIFLRCKPWEHSEE